MDPFHARLARVGLNAAARYGFCLAGGYAVQAHGMVERHSEDVDLFSTMAAEEDFPDAAEAVVKALRTDHLDVTVQVKSPTFARLSVVDPETGTVARVELGLDWRAHPPITLEIGPVLHADDAVANKACALFGRVPCRGSPTPLSYGMSSVDTSALIARIIDYAEQIQATKP
ncbi:MAG TPA: nucleotidyl transferase AbiEii/AbiGii toxin family protein [Mycobacteriales bacterium]|nr:nucleotidyl transferase AbiEii/AbiGii toxin family protein [Mycobacteriales bacterium]